MEVQGKRVMFGPPRGYTSSIWDYFKVLPDYHTHKTKEFDRDTIHAMSDEDAYKEYLQGYDGSKPFIDCCLLYYNNHANLSFIKDLLFTDLDCSVYNVRSYKAAVKSYYLMVMRTMNKFYMVDDFEYYDQAGKDRLFDFAYNRFSVEWHLNYIKNTCRYKGDVYFVQGVDIHEVMNTFNMRIPNYGLQKLNSTASHLVIKPRLKYMLERFREFERYWSDNIEKCHVVRENNIKILKESRFIGKFDEDLYRRE